MLKTIGIDIGTTTISAVVLDADEKRAVESRTIQNGCFVCTGNEWERMQDAAAVSRFRRPCCRFRHFIGA